MNRSHRNGRLSGRQAAGHMKNASFFGLRRRGAEIDNPRQ